MAAARQGRTGRSGRAPARAGRTMSHRARRQLAPSPDAIADRVANAVGAAFDRWAQRFLRLVLSDLVPTKFRADSAVRANGSPAGVVHGGATPHDHVDCVHRHLESHLNNLADADCAQLVVRHQEHIDAADLLDGAAGRSAGAGASEVDDVTDHWLHVSNERRRSGRLEHFLRQDATLQGLFEEAGHADPERKLLEEAFKGLDRQSGDEVRVAGVRTADVVPGGPALQQQWVRRNTDLIKAEADLRRRVERVISDPLNEGRSVADIAKLLQEQAGYSKSRAELTARDQTLKLYGQIQQERQTTAGITHYIWTTSLDERVREDHAALDGTTQAWDDPPIVDQRTGRTGHPGSDFQCRCTAVPVLPEFDDAPAERAVEPPPREPAVFPAPGEAEARAAQRAAESERRRLEAEADLRIARAAEQRRVEATIAERQAAAQRERERTERAAREPKVNTAKTLKAAAKYVTVAKDVPAEAKDAVARGLAKVRAVPLHPEVPALSELNVATRAVSNEGADMNGFYQYGDRSLHIGTSRTRADILPHLRDLGAPDLWSMSYVNPDPLVALMNTTMHEYAHHLHLSTATASAPALRQVDARIKRAYAEIVNDTRPGVKPQAEPAGRAPTMYARTNPDELWAESFTMYQHDADWMRANKPEAYQLVVDVLALLAP